MRKFIFYTVFCEKMGILSKEETAKILKNNLINLKQIEGKQNN
ncbi:hypothetical protein J6TS2_49580 [Heyndrickxia sporothermodurans]|nr:hypothetical protein J6TS2_49580 [Heyndrickxia sporothermodurans]